MQVRVRHADGRWRWLEAVAADLRAEPTVQGLMVTSRDITHRKELEEQLERQAFTDALTGLANRALFMQRLEKALTRVRRHGDPAAVLFIDLDDFKPINDRLGHEVGDRVLVHASERIRSALRESDTPARFGGDEFAVLLEDLGDEDDPQLVARRILEALARPEDGAAWAQPLAASLGGGHGARPHVRRDDHATRGPRHVTRRRRRARTRSRPTSRGCTGRCAPATARRSRPTRCRRGISSGCCPPAGPGAQPAPWLGWRPSPG